ncbi:hypothetical protein BGZ94_009084 [Podila epigama]|nr:hypothetical protein BGZ94_009084 [Podila epigama]
MSLSTLRYSRTGIPIHPTTVESKKATMTAEDTTTITTTTTTSSSMIASYGSPKSPFKAHPSLLQRAYLRGILYKPGDLVFLAKLIAHITWALVRVHCIELPYLIVTRFRYPTRNHPLGWSWLLTVAMAIIRNAGPLLKTVGHLRFCGLIVDPSMTLLSFFIRHIKVEKSVQFKVHLETLLMYERASLAQVRQDLKKAGASDDAINPSLEYLLSMHPHPSASVPGKQPRLANIPEEVGAIENDGTYTLKGEWIEAIARPNDPRPRSKVVILYLHGARRVGPGTRIFSVDYRMAPEHPFPAAIHDALAAYIYLTEPKHQALRLDKTRSSIDNVPVDPRDIVVGGDSAGANLAAAFMLYMTNYVQPVTEPKFILPHATLLISIWADVTSSLPAAGDLDGYCYCPHSIGTSPFDRKAFMEFTKFNLGANYVIGDVHTVPNARNAFGDERRWLWYQHLAQHPLVSPVHRANVSGATNTLIHTGTHDRLLDDNRLYAHRLGLANPDKMTRIEVYEHMIHVHHAMSFLPEAHVAATNIARFIHRSKHLQQKILKTQQEDATEITVAQADTQLALEQKEQEQQQEQQYHQHKDEIKAPHKMYTPLFMRPGMTRNKMPDNVEWVLVKKDGKEVAKDEGWPMSVLLKAWPKVEPIQHVEE